MGAIYKKIFGELSDGCTVEIYTLRNSNGVAAQFIDYGARLVSWRVADKNGSLVDVVLSYGNVVDYERADNYMGATVGHCANRIGGAKFILNGNNHLHGGFDGFDKKFWRLKLSMTS